MVSETKIDMLFPTSQFVIQGLAAFCRLDRTNTGGGILVYVRDDIHSKLLNISYVSSDTECLVIEINLDKVATDMFIQSSLRQYFNSFDESQQNY